MVTSRAWSHGTNQQPMLQPVNNDEATRVIDTFKSLSRSLSVLLATSSNLQLLVFAPPIVPAFRSERQREPEGRLESRNDLRREVHLESAKQPGTGDCEVKNGRPLRSPR